ncbi:MAG: ATP-binding cassette domain-containing protein [Candidatus Coatesbacteria bacterium]|nr:ATP-binding cassette domain-containing protein [Candidatus Coatesbacteria bacterium]
MRESTTAAVEVAGLSKSFGAVVAVAGVDFAVRPGEVFGLLGPNGAGKTTTIKLLTGLARPDGGRIRYYGEDYTARLKAAQHLFGVVADGNNFYNELSGRENLEFCAALYGVERGEARRRATELLERFGLEGAAERPFGGYSRGMGRRLCIAAALIHRPRLLFLDEPTTGIDVPNARDIRRLLAGLGEEGTTIFLTTHYLEEAERLCDRAAFIDRGRIVRLASVAELLTDAEGRQSLELELDTEPAALLPILRHAFPLLEWRILPGRRLRVSSLDGIELAPLTALLTTHGVRVFEARRLRPSLEEVFIAVTGNKGGEAVREKGGGRG